MSHKLPVRMSFPGTIHAINPHSVPEDSDHVLLSAFGQFVRWIGVLATLYVLVISIGLIMRGVAGLDIVNLEQLLKHASNPLVFLCIGGLATFLVQSSTAITTITVVAVGSGALSIDAAVLLILGANVGTCFTAILVAYGFAGSPLNFSRALAAALTHWWFNFFTCVILLPIELMFHPLARSTAWLTQEILRGNVSTRTGFWSAQLVAPLFDATIALDLITPFDSPVSAAVIGILAGSLLIIICGRLLSIQLKTLMAYRTYLLFEHSSDGKTNLQGFATGLGLTILSHSSSATTSAIVPLAGVGTLSLRPVLAIILGANVGTTATALVAALAVPGDTGSLAVQAALVHVFVNIVPALVLLLVAPVRIAFLKLTETTAAACTRFPLLSFISWLGVFIGAPAAVVALFSL